MIKYFGQLIEKNDRPGIKNFIKKHVFQTNSKSQQKALSIGAAIGMNLQPSIMYVFFLENIKEITSDMFNEIIHSAECRKLVGQDIDKLPLFDALVYQIFIRAIKVENLELAEYIHKYSNEGATRQMALESSAKNIPSKKIIKCNFWTLKSDVSQIMVDSIVIRNSEHSLQCLILYLNGHKAKCEECSNMDVGHVLYSILEYLAKTMIGEGDKYGYEIIVKEFPDFESIYSTKFETCHGCFELPEVLFVCTKCSMANYCDEKCQLKHWPIHKKNCKLADKSDNQTEEII